MRWANPGAVGQAPPYRCGGASPTLQMRWANPPQADTLLTEIIGIPFQERK